MSDDRSGGIKSGFTVTDRRSFADAAAPVESAAAPDAADSPGAPTSASEAAPAPSAHPELDFPEAGDGALPAVDFHTFVLSLGSSALMHLGELDHPDGAALPPDLALAKHTIDIIAMLEQKTKGNLTPPESRLIESLLFDLRLRYVELLKARS